MGLTSRGNNINSVTNSIYAPGESLEIILSGSTGTPNQLAVQVDFVKI